jgi:hypothetical protein
MRLAGTAKQYSKPAISHETRMAFQSGQSWPYFKWPYQAKVMKTLEQVRRSIVVMVVNNFFIILNAPAVIFKS